MSYNMNNTEFGDMQETLGCLGFIPPDMLLEDNLDPEATEIMMDDSDADQIFANGEYVDMDLSYVGYVGEDDEYEYFLEEYSDASGRSRRRAKRKKRKAKRQAKRTKRRERFAKKHPKLAKHLKKRRKLLAKVGRVFTAPGMAPRRVAMLKLISKNTWQMATDLNTIRSKAQAGDKQAKADWDRKLKQWYAWGGNRKKFIEAIDKGHKKKGKNPAWKKVKGADGSEMDIIDFTYDDYQGFIYETDNGHIDDNDFINDLPKTHEDEEGYANAAGIITTVVSLAASLISKLFKGKKNKKGQTTNAPSGMTDETVKSMVEQAVAEEPAVQEELKYEKANPKPEAERDKDVKITPAGAMKLPWKKIVIGVGIFAAIGTAIYFVTKKN